VSRDGVSWKRSDLSGPSKPDNPTGNRGHKGFGALPPNDRHRASSRPYMEDLDARRMLFATEGRDNATVAAFATDLAGDPERISDTSSDMN